MKWLNWTSLMFAGAVIGLVAGVIAWIAGLDMLADWLWALVGLAALVSMTLAVGRGILRRQLGVDVIAILAIAGALALEEYLAAAVIGLMMATGQALEDYAGSRAERELSALLQRAPRFAHRIDGEVITTIAAEDVRVGDTLVVKDADVVPVDGQVAAGFAVLDESALTGESRLVTRSIGDSVKSGTTNAGGAFRMRAVAIADESTYAGVVRLVRTAQEGKAPFVRMADRYAQLFIPLTLAVAAGGWIISGEPERALAVLVVATPCPLILAAPIAMVSGISRAARRGIVVKGGETLEILSKVQTLFLDKTGTITTGSPEVEGVRLFGSGHDSDKLLRLAASVDQVSSHVMAAAMMRGARVRDLALSLPENVHEEAGAGVRGEVENHRVRVGTFEFVTSGMELDHARRRFGRRLLREASSVAFVAIDDDLAGAIVLEDPIRPEAAYVIREAKRYGIQQTVMVTGDDVAIAAPVGAALGIDRVQAGLTPAEKVAAVADASRTSIVLMVGDGINDAPALAMASVGIAMGARGATAASEAADAVIVVDRLDRIIDAIRIGRRSRSIALQSVLVGMGLSFVAMGFAAAGLLPPVAGAILQEGIDAIAILNALRALTGTPYERRRDVLDDATATELREGHRQMMAALGMLRRLADHVGELPAPELHAEVGRVREFLADVAEHERHDETEVMPKIAEALGGPDPLAAISRTHQELFHLISDFDQLTSDLPPAGLESEDLPDLRRVLYSLFTILRLNIAQEEELYRSLNDDYLVLEEAKASS